MRSGVDAILIETCQDLGQMKVAVRAAKELIAAGDIYQANLTFPLAGSYRGDPLALYAALRPAAAIQTAMQTSTLHSTPLKNAASAGRAVLAATSASAR